MPKPRKKKDRNQDTQDPTIPENIVTSISSTTPSSPNLLTPSPNLRDNSFFDFAMSDDDHHDKDSAKSSTKEYKEYKPPPWEEARIHYTLDEDLENLLREIFGIRRNDTKHELLQALSNDSITSWKTFRRLQPEAIDSLTKKTERGRVPIAKSINMELNVLLRYIRERIDNKEPYAKDIDYYDAEEFEDYLDIYYQEKRHKAVSDESSITPPTPLKGGYSVKGRTEKALDTWERKKLTKTNFDILHEDGKYKIWKETFTAEIKVQGLSRMIDPTFKKQSLQDQFDRELYQKQSDYFWTVLLYSLQNPVAEVILGKHRDISDARTAFLAVDEKMKGKISQMYNVSDLSDQLRDLHISNFPGTRVQFIAKWSETLRQLNKVAEKEDRLTFVHVRSQLMRAINTDRDLTNSFTELKEEPDRDLATAKLMEHLLEKAILYDGRDGTTAPTERQQMKAMLHKMGLSDDDHVIVNKSYRGPPEDCKLPDELYRVFSREDKTQWRSFSDNAKRAIIAKIRPDNAAAPYKDTAYKQRTPNRDRENKRKAYMQYLEDKYSDTNSIADDLLDAEDDHSAAIHTVQALRHSLADAELRLYDVEQAANDDSTTYTAMSSITNQSRPPSKSPTKFEKEPDTNNNDKRQPMLKKSSLGRGHPTRVMARKMEIEREIQQRNVSFFGKDDISIKKHNIFYDELEEELDRTTATGQTHTTVYNVSKRSTNRKTSSSLIDRGANGCVGGDDCVLLGYPVVERSVHITGMDDHQVRDVPIATVGSYAVSNRGPVICIFNEMALTGRGQSILSSIQLEHFGNRVDERVCALGGGQQISTADGYNFPLSIVNGLAYLQMRRYTEEEYFKYPHVIMTSDQIWDPRKYDNYIDPKSEKYKAANPINLHLLPHDDYNVEGEYIGVHHNESNTANVPLWMDNQEFVHNETVARCSRSSNHKNICAYDTTIKTSPQPRLHMATDRDYEKLKPYFAWIPTKLIKRTFMNSTQYGFMPVSPDGNLFKRWKSPNPAMNVFRLQDDLLTDKIHSNTPAIDGGFTEAQVFFGRKSHIIHPESISRTKSFLRCIQNFVRKWGAPIRMLADSISYHSSHQVLDYLRILWIQLWFSEAYHQHQNPFERRYQTFKRIINRTMERTSTPPELWFLCMCYVAYVMNRVSDPTLNYRQPILVATGSIGDISAITTYQWLEPVYYKKDGKQFSFPDTGEGFGYFVGIAENVGHSMTYKVWKKDTNKIIERSNVRSAWDKRFPNNLASERPVDDVSAGRMPEAPHVGDRIAKIFNNTIFFGTIEEFWVHDMSPLWHICYDDGDEEDLTPSALSNALRLYANNSLDDRLYITKTNNSTQQNNGETSKFHQSTTDFVYTRGDDTKSQTEIDEDCGENQYLHDSAVNESEYSMALESDRKFRGDGTPLVVLTDENGYPKNDSQGNAIMVPGRTTDELKGITFKHHQDDGTVLRARVLGPCSDYNNGTEGMKFAEQFKIKYDRNQVEDTMGYNEIMNYIHRDETDEQGTEWKFRKILGHRPVTTRDPAYRNSLFNVSVEWENGEITEEGLTWMIEQDPLIMSKYAMEHQLLETDGWKKLKRFARRTKLLERLIKQAKLRSYRTSPKFMYGFQVPRDYDEAMELDRQNGNNRWADAIRLEMEQLHDYEVFLDQGLYYDVGIPEGFKKIRVHLVFAVKHDERHKARLVADGHLTALPLNSVYAGVVSIRGLRICIFLAELNGLEAHATDVGNAYLEAVTQEKVCIKAGPEFGELEGHMLVVYKALYGLRSSGKQFGDLLANCLKELGFKPSLAEPQIFLRRNGDIYEYIATYVDDLCLVMKDPISFLKILQSDPYSFKLKGSGPMSFHLGCGFNRDENGVLCMDPLKYIEKMAQAYEQLFGIKLGTKPRSPLEEGDHPELDTSEFLDDEDTQKYQSLIGSMQWVITLGRWDVQTAVMTLSSFRAKPRKGHLLRAKRVCAYINRFKYYKLRFRTDEPDLSDLDGATDVDWSKDVYEEFREEIPTDKPPPLGKRVTFVHWFDASLMHDVLSGKAVTGCVHFVNKTPIMWYSKKQATTETATYGAEFCAGRTCIEQVIDLRNTFRYLGVPVHDISYVFGDNKSMIDSSTYPYARLHKRHNILSYHYVRSMIARGFIALTHTNSGDNLADVVTKHWSYNTVKNLLKPVFYHSGDTNDLYDDDE